MWDSSFFHALSWVFMKNIEVWKFTHFLVRIWDSSYFHTFWYVLSFHEKYPTFKFREIPVLLMRLHLFSWKISNLNIHPFPSSDFRFKIFSNTLMSFHKKILNFQSSAISQLGYEIQAIFIHFDEFLWKILNFQSSPSLDMGFKGFLALSLVSFENIPLSNFERSQSF